MKHKKIWLALLLVLTLTIGAGVGGTVAWLATNTEAVTNTFVYGDIEIELKEYKDGLKVPEATEVTSMSNLAIVPGVNIPKYPFLRVLPNSEDCWVFVKVKEENWPAEHVTYEVEADASHWVEVTPAKQLGGGETLYAWHETIKKNTSLPTELAILKGNSVIVDDALQKPSDSKAPSLTFTGYAIQKGKWNTAKDAWDAIYPAP